MVAALLRSGKIKPGHRALRLVETTAA
jgi:hypothetical protein